MTDSEWSEEGAGLYYCLDVIMRELSTVLKLCVGKRVYLSNHPFLSSNAAVVSSLPMPISHRTFHKLLSSSLSTSMKPKRSLRVSKHT